MPSVSKKHDDPQHNDDDDKNPRENPAPKQLHKVHHPATVPHTINLDNHQDDPHPDNTDHPENPVPKQLPHKVHNPLPARHAINLDKQFADPNHDGTDHPENPVAKQLHKVHYSPDVPLTTNVDKRLTLDQPHDTVGHPSGKKGVKNHRDDNLEPHKDPGFAEIIHRLSLPHSVKKIKPHRKPELQSGRNTSLFSSPRRETTVTQPDLPITNVREPENLLTGHRNDHGTPKIKTHHPANFKVSLPTSVDSEKRHKRDRQKKQTLNFEDHPGNHFHSDSFDAVKKKLELHHNPNHYYHVHLDKNGTNVAKKRKSTAFNLHNLDQDNDEMPQNSGGHPRRNPPREISPAIHDIRKSLIHSPATTAHAVHSPPKPSPPLTDHRKEAIKATELMEGEGVARPNHNNTKVRGIAKASPGPTPRGTTTSAPEFSHSPAIQPVSLTTPRNTKLGSAPQIMATDGNTPRTTPRNTPRSTRANAEAGVSTLPHPAVNTNAAGATGPSTSPRFTVNTNSAPPGPSTLPRPTGNTDATNPAPVKPLAPRRRTMESGKDRRSLGQSPPHVTPEIPPTLPTLENPTQSVPRWKPARTRLAPKTRGKPVVKNTAQTDDLQSSRGQNDHFGSDQPEDTDDDFSLDDDFDDEDELGPSNRTFDDAEGLVISVPDSFVPIKPFPGFPPGTRRSSKRKLTQKCTIL